jgi:small GTP-binding protein
MGLVYSRFLEIFRVEKIREISIVGLDNAGKTTILYQMKLSSTVETIPTVGFNVESVRINGTTVNIWDIGGQDEIRELWDSYTESSAGIVFVVDMVDSQRWGKARDVLKATLTSSKSQKKKPVLILANKVDDPSKPGLDQEVEEMVDKLEIRGLNVDFEAFHCSAIKCSTNPEPLKRLIPAFDWLVKAVKADSAV